MMGGVGMSSCGSFPVLWTGDCPGRVMAVPWQGVVARRSLEQWDCSSHVSRPAGSSCSKPKTFQEEPGVSQPEKCYAVP